MMGSRLFPILITSLALAGCATAGSSSQSLPKQDPNVITTEEIADSPNTNAYELIQRLRPAFLRTRGAVRGAPSNGVNSIQPVDVVVYLNDTRLGTSDQLRQIATSDIREIRYYSASDATTKWGTGNIAGAIQVVTR
jgi:hypothetical protein